MDLPENLWCSVAECLSIKCLFQLTQSTTNISTIIHPVLLRRAYPLKTAAALGDLNMIRWIVQHTNMAPASNDISSSLYHAAENNHLDVCQWLTAHFGNYYMSGGTKTPSFLAAAENGNLAMCEWMASQFDLKHATHQAFMTALKDSHFHVCKWIICHFQFTKCDILNRQDYFPSLLVQVAQKSSEMYQWMVTHFNVSANDKKNVMYLALQTAAKEGDLSFLKWMVAHFQLNLDYMKYLHNPHASLLSNYDILNGVPYFALTNGHIHVCEWICSHFEVDVFELLEDEYRELRFFHTEFCVLENLCKLGLLSACHWLLDHYLETWLGDSIVRGSAFPLTCCSRFQTNLNSALLIAAENGHLYMCEWLVDHFVYTPDDVKTGNCRIFYCACVKGHLDVCQWLADTFHISNSDVSVMKGNPITKAGIKGHLDVCKWLVSRFNLGVLDTTFCGAARKGWIEVCTWIAKLFHVTPYIAVTAYKEASNTDMCNWLISRFDLKESDRLLKLEPKMETFMTISEVVEVDTKSN